MHKLHSLSVYAGITGSLSGSATTALTASYAATASVATSSSYALSASYAPGGSGLTGGTANYIPVWTSATAQSSSIIYQSSSQNIIIGIPQTQHPEAPPLLEVNMSSSTNPNIAHFHGNIDSTLDLAFKNYSSGPSASAEFKLVTDAGTPASGYLGIGVNSSNYALPNRVGTAGDAFIRASGSNDLLIGNAAPDKKIILFAGGENAIDNARVYIDSSGSVGININTPTIGNPEALLVQAITDSYNLITAKANLDSYSQINITNLNGGASASSDIVATANNGSETSNYIDMGINSDQYGLTNVVGGPNDAYLYSTGNDLHIGNASSGRNLQFFIGGLDSEATTKLTLRDTNIHTLSGSLVVVGSVTASVFGTASWAQNAISSSAATTASYVIPTGLPTGTVSSSVQINTGSFSGSFIGTLTGTSSWATNSVSSSYALTSSFSVSASFAPTILPAGVVSSSVQINTGSFTGSFIGQFTGTSSWANNSVSSSFATTALTASYFDGFVNFPNGLVVTGSLNVSGSITGSLLGTSSWAQNAISSSYALTASYVSGAAASTVSSSYALTSSYAVVAENVLGSVTSASYAATASVLLGSVVSASFATSALTASYVSGGVTFPEGLDITGSLTVTGSVNVTGSLRVTQGFTGSLFGTSSWAVSASWAPGGAGTVTSITAGDGLNGGTITSAGTIALDTSSVHFLDGVKKELNTEGVISSSTQFTSLTSPFTGSFTGSLVGSLTGTASWAQNATSASFALTASYVSGAASNWDTITNKPSGLVSSSTQTIQHISSSTIQPQFITASKGVFHDVTVQGGYLELYPVDTNFTADPNSVYFYISGSNNDLWYTHKTNSTVNFDWIEGVMETGLLYGGIAGFSGSNVYIREGKGIIVTHGATTASAPSPTVNYVQWIAQTSSIDVTNGYVTYLAINASGLVESSSTKFSSLDYHDKIPLGAVGHFNNVAIAAQGEQINTQYSPLAQLTDFTRNFGPIKVGGYGITAQSGSLMFSRAAGNAFIYGGFYSQTPETPSNYQSIAVATGSFAYLYRTASAQGYGVDANNNLFYTNVKPGFYDIGTGTSSLASNEWSIQRVFIEPVTGIHYIYYGQSKYTSLANAVANILTDPFAEGAATSLFTVFAGYLIMKGDTTNLADTGSNNILSAGLFRNTSAGSVGGGAAAQLLNDLSDVTITTPSNGQALVYSSGDWVNGIPSTSSFATTASFAANVPKTKVGSITNSAFSGNPRKAAVNFSSPFVNTSYAIVITGEDARSWTYEGKVVGGFTASANSNTVLAGTTTWIATAYGET